MSEPQRDWEGPRPAPEAKIPAAPAEAIQPPPGLDQILNSTNKLDTPEFVLGASIEPADDSPTIISRTVRKPGQTDEAIANSLRGRRLAHFELQAPVGVGGMAAVIRAHDTQLDRLVALKILPPNMATDPESLRRFQHEARAAARLDHENIARVFYCGEDQGLHFIAFEFVEGDNLRTILDRRGRLPVPEAIRYMLQVATGLAHAASRGVVHRDIKPSNIIITPTGRAKLVDMGLARSNIGPQGDGALTQSGVTLGTFDYISPEQALEPRDADVRSDIYSLGCTFYHMLTGQPPVPEGTAAKKLHHHQHVPPVDPRQLNPAIPDDVAAVLSRMMAKQPGDRYQRSEHLVQHLLVLAQKTGAGAEVPEGVLFVDAPLPSPPQSRPLVVGGIAAAALVVFIVVLTALPTTPNSVDFAPLDAKPRSSESAVNKGDKTPPVVKSTQTQERPPQPVVAPPSRPIVAQTTKDLFEAVKQPTAQVLLPGKEIDLRLKRDEGPDLVGLVFQGKELVLQAEDPAKRPTLLLTYDTSGKDQPWAALTVAGGQVTLRNLRFKIDATGTATPMAAVVRAGGRIRFENCEFWQSGFPSEPERARLASVEVSGASNETSDGSPDVFFERCYFRSGHEAVLITATANAEFNNCAFGPHAALFHFRSGKVEDAQLRLQHCSALLGQQSAVFVLSEDASARLSVNHCLFSNPLYGQTETDGETTLVRQLGDGPPRFRIDSESRNVYHGFSAFWTQSGRTQVRLFEEFQQRPGTGRNDRSVSLLSANPWQFPKPLTLLAQPEKAFQARQDLPELRRLDHPKTRMVGVERCVWGSVYPATLRPLKEKIVDITVKESANGVYPSLSQALGEAQPGDTILIKANDTVTVPPLRLEDRPVLTDLLIKPYENFRPILKLGSTTDLDAAMFRFGDGRLVLENLEFELPPTPAGLKTQSVVYVTGEGQCTFKKCLFTLKEPREAQAPRSLFMLPDPSSVMRKDNKGPSQGGPRLRLENCFVRGDGELVTVRGSQAFNLEVEESLIALDGSLLIMDGSTKEPPTKPPVQISVARTTIYVSEPLLVLRACESKPMPGLVPTHVVQVANCVIASGREKNALVHLEGMDSDEQMRRLFTWEGGKQNIYSGFMNMLEQRPRPDNAMPLSQFDRSKWLDFTPKETDRRFDKVTFAGWPPAVDRPLARALPSYFRIKLPADVSASGVDVDRVPRPPMEPEAPSGTPPGDE
jgi:serine/threonine protein kinase